MRFLAELVRRSGLRMQDHLLAIKSVAVACLKHDVSNTVKAAAFAPVIEIFELNLPHLDAATLGIADLARSLMTELSRNAAATSQTVKVRLGFQTFS